MKRIITHNGSLRFKLFLAVFSALLTALSFPPFKVGFIIYFAPLLLLFALEETSPRRAFFIGYVWGLVFNLGILYGVFWATIPGTFGMLTVISLVPAINCLVYAFVSRRAKLLGYIVWPLVWVTFDYLRTLSELAFPWGDFGYTQTYYLPLIQAAEIFAVYGVSLMIHTVNILLYAFLKSNKHGLKKFVPLGAAVLLPLLFLTYGWLRLPQKTIPGDFKVVLAQGNITRDIKWKRNGDRVSLDTYLDMSRQAGKFSPNLIIWPETSMLCTWLPQGLRTGGLYFSNTTSLKA